MDKILGVPSDLLVVLLLVSTYLTIAINAFREIGKRVRENLPHKTAKNFEEFISLCKRLCCNHVMGELGWKNKGKEIVFFINLYAYSSYGKSVFYHEVCASVLESDINNYHLHSFAVVTLDQRLEELKQLLKHARTSIPDESHEQRHFDFLREYALQNGIKPLALNRTTSEGQVKCCLCKKDLPYGKSTHIDQRDRFAVIIDGVGEVCMSCDKKLNPEKKHCLDI